MTWRARARRSTFPPREVEIGRFDLIELTPTDSAVFEIECGKGTYVRSLARDMGRDLGCFGHIATLRRTEVDPFTADDLVTVAELEAASPRDAKPSEAEPPLSDFYARSTRCWSTRARRWNACRRSRSPTMRRTASGSAIR